MPKRSAQKESYWRGMLRQQRQSGLNIRQFCSDHQLSEASFHRWKREIAKRAGQDQRVSGPEAQKRLRHNGTARQSSQASLFIPLKLSAAVGSMIEVVHPRGYLVRLPAVFDENSLNQVLNILDQRQET